MRFVWMDSIKMLYRDALLLIVGSGSVIVFVLVLPMAKGRPLFTPADISDDSEIRNEVRVNLELKSDYCQNGTTVLEGGWTLTCTINTGRSRAFKGVYRFSVFKFFSENLEKHCSFLLFRNGTFKDKKCKPENMIIGYSANVTDLKLVLTILNITQEDNTRWYCEADYYYEQKGISTTARTQKEAYDLGEYCRGKPDNYPPTTTSAAAPSSDAGDTSKSSLMKWLFEIGLFVVAAAVAVAVAIKKRRYIRRSCSSKKDNGTRSEGTSSMVNYSQLGSADRYRPSASAEEIPTLEL